jgi:hypothetical protein
MDFVFSVVLSRSDLSNEIFQNLTKGPVFLAELSGVSSTEHIPGSSTSAL